MNKNKNKKGKKHASSDKKIHKAANSMIQTEVSKPDANNKLLKKQLDLVSNEIEGTKGQKVQSLASSKAKDDPDLYKDDPFNNPDVSLQSEAQTEGKAGAGEFFNDDLQVPEWPHYDDPVA